MSKNLLSFPREPRIALVIAGMFASVAGCAPRALAPPSDQQANALLAERMSSDPNGALCQRIVARFDAGDADALGDYVDRPAMVERAIAAAGLNAARAAQWRAAAERIDNLSRLTTPKGSRFFCLGTFEDASGAKALMLRVRKPCGFDHVILRLGGSSRARPIDDYLVASSGYWHSALQTAFESPGLAPYKETRDWMFAASFEGKFHEIIAKYETLPLEVRRSELIFVHYVNAVMTTTRRGAETASERFPALGDAIVKTFSHPIARAYWLVTYYARMGMADAARAQVAALTEPYRDPIALDLQRWVDDIQSGSL